MGVGEKAALNIHKVVEIVRRTAQGSFERGNRDSHRERA